jgi:ABC-type branched-subunit amino acid transport system substrate-binding protein
MFKLIVAFLLFGPFAVANVLAQTPITIHHIGPFTGVLAASNKESVDGAQIFFEGLNARGGVQGHPLRLETQDDAQDPKRTVALFEQLVADKKLLALLLPRSTPSMEALLPGVAQHGVPVIGPQTGGSFVNQPPRREVFTLRASYQKEAESAIRLQHTIGVRSFGLLLADDAFGRDTLINIDKVFKELKIEPVATAKVDNRKPDVTAAVAALVAKQPQVVLLIVSSKAGYEFVKAYYQKGGRATFIALSNCSNNDFIQGLGERARGVIVMQTMPSPFSATTALAREYSAAAAKHNAPLSYAGLYGFASAKLLSLGLAKAGPSTTSAGLIQALEGLGEVDLGGYRVRYGPGERVGSNFVDSAIITDQGRFMR